MKKLYSSTFLSIILAFFTYLGMQEQQIDIVKSEPIPVFSNITKPDIQPIDEFGTKSAIEKVSIEVFYTFECKGCDNFGLNTVPALIEKYSEDEKINLQIYLNPDTKNDGQYFAVKGIKCAEEYEKYWEMHRELFLIHEPLSQREVDLTGQVLELPLYEFRNCLKSEKYHDFMNAVNDVAKEKGVTKMPVVYINDYVLTGNQPIENIQKVINEIQYK